MTAETDNGRIIPPYLLKTLAWIGGILFGLCLLYYQIQLLTFMDWEDESETVVGAKLMIDGARLYGDFFNHHGPLTFLPGWLVEHVGSFGVAAHRVPIAILQWLALAALALSPLFSSRLIGLTYAGFVGALMLLWLPELYGHTYAYQVMAGLFLIIILAQYCLPAFTDHLRLTASRILLGNLLLASLPFLAVTYAPVAALLFFASLRPGYIRLAIAGAAAGVLLNLLFLLAVGSFPGYMAYHFYLNAVILPEFAQGHGLLQMLNAVLMSITDRPQHLLLSILVVFALSRLAMREGGFPWRTFLLVAGLASLLLRGHYEFHRLAYLYACLALPMLFFNRVARPGYAWIPVAALMLVMAAKLLVLLPHDRERLDAWQLPDQTEFSQLVKLMTNPDDRIIAYAFRNQEYILSERLPASGNYFYFPWQEAYNEAPVLGVQIDTCADIEQERPKLMMIDGVDVLGLHPWDSYGACVQEIMDRDYQRIAHRPFYVRKDFDLAAYGIAEAGSAYAERPGPQLEPDGAVPLLLDQGYLDHGQPVQRIGIRFVLPQGRAEGKAQLNLKSEEGAHVTIPFDLSEIRLHRYFYFDMTPELYLSGYIEIDGETDVRLLESHAEGEALATCLVYEYTEDSRRYTPGCPFI